MASIDLDDCTVSTQMVGGVKVVKIVTPATADDGDTIDCSTLFESGCFALVVGESDGLNLETKTSFGTTITLPGSTDNEARTILAIGI